METARKQLALFEGPSGATSTPAIAHPDEAHDADTALEEHIGAVVEVVEREAGRRPRRSGLPTRNQLRARRAHLQRLTTTDPTTLPGDLGPTLAATECTIPAVASLPWALLATGFAKEQLIECRVVATRADVPSKGSGPWLVVEDPAWVVANSVNGVLPTAHEHACPSRIDLPIDRATPGIDQVLAHARRRLGRTLYQRTDFNDLAAWLSKKHDHAFWTGRLGQLVPKLVRACVRDATGDGTMEAYLFNEHPDPRVLPRMHYPAVRPSMLADIHAQAILTAAESIGLPRRTLVPMPVCADEPRVGSVFLPREADVVAWVSRLRSACEPRPRGKPTVDKVIAFHNAFVVYTVECLLWATGVRPTTDGLAALAPVAGHVIVDEKAKPIAAARALRLARTAHDQWEHYAHHRDWICSWLGISPGCPFFVVRRGDGTSVLADALVPGELARRAASGFKENAHRHALATALLEGGWPAYRRNAWMGHGVFGDEPGAPYWALDPQATPRELQVIEQHLKRHGWIPCKGMGRG